jgi:hypothetical protein
MVLNAISWLEVFAIRLLRLSFLRQRVARQLCVVATAGISLALDP